jgi:RNA polymerase sigma-70 factor (ECF subfamily)
MRDMPADPGGTEAAIRAAQGGAIAAFNSLVQHYQQQVYNVCYRTLGNPEDAADATQEAFLAAYRAIASFRGPAAGFRAWLLRIAVNACYDQLRRRRRRAATSLDALGRDAEDSATGHEPGPIERLVDPAPGPEQQVLSFETARGIQAMLARLSPDHRLTVTLCDVQGLSYQEVAEIMAVELGTVKSRLSRARAQLRELLLAAGELPHPAQRLEQ